MPSPGDLLNPGNDLGSPALQADSLPAKLSGKPHGYGSWAIKKVEHWRTDAFKLWCWRLLRVSWTARRSYQSILKAINPEYSLEGLMLKFQYSGHLMWRANSLEKTHAGKDWRQKEKGQQRTEWLDRITDSVDMNLSKLWKIVKDRAGRCAAVHRVAKSQTQLRDWTKTTGSKPASA